jgi:pimeloyl-ACP methyl ester carboxylesterase
MRPLLGGITCPTLVIQGEQDEHASPQHARDIAAAIPGAGLWLLPGTGHMLPQEADECFNSRLIEFIGGKLK